MVASTLVVAMVVEVGVVELTLLLEAGAMAGVDARGVHCSRSQRGPLKKFRKMPRNYRGLEETFLIMGPTGSPLDPLKFFHPLRGSKLMINYDPLWKTILAPLWIPLLSDTLD